MRGVGKKFFKLHPALKKKALKPALPNSLRELNSRVLAEKRFFGFERNLQAGFSEAVTARGGPGNLDAEPITVVRVCWQKSRRPRQEYGFLISH